MQDNKSRTTKIVKFLGLNIILPIAISTVTLIIQYHTGFFDPTKGSPLNPFTLFLIIFFFINFLVSLNRLKTVWFNSHKYFREDFSFAAFWVVTWMMGIIAMCMITRIMLWHICLGFFQVFSNKKVSLPPASIEGYLLLLLFGTLIFILISQTYRGWKGQKSTQQYESEQRSETSNFFVEGLAELSRKIKQASPLVPYSEIDPNRLASPLESVTDSLSWQEQARELLRLSSSSYSFDHNSWHDRQECWIGENINTNELIFLYPVQSSLDEQSLDNCRKYARQIVQNKQKQIGEIVIAFQSQASALATPTCSDIRFETQDSFLDNLVNFTDYKNEIRKRVMVSKLPESELTLNQVYTPPEREVLLSDYLQDWFQESSRYVENYLKEWLQEPSRKQIALLGGYGQGKSSTALMLSYQLLFENPQTSTRIPLLIELRGMSPRNLTPLALLGAWASPYRIDPQALMRLLIAGRLLLIFEGFDEMALIGNMEARRKHFETLWKFCYPQNKILITGRPNFFLDDQEMKKALGIDKPIGDNPYCEAIRLAPFSVEQIHKSLREQPLIQSQIVDLAKNDTRFCDLISRPSLLHVVSVLWEKENFANQVARLNSAYVMERFVNSSYRRQGLKNQDSQEFMALNSSERSYFMSGIACYIAANKLNNQIPSEKLNQVIEELIDCIPDSVSTVSSIAGEETRPLKLRIKNQEPKEAVEHIKTDTRTCGLLVDDPATHGTFKFGHKSFMEYLFAATIAEYINNTKSEKARAILKATDASLTDLLDLPVSIEFLSELIGVNHNLETSGSLVVKTSNQLKSERIFAKKLLNVIRFGHKEKAFIHFMYDFILFNQSYHYSANFIDKNSQYIYIKKKLIRLITPVAFFSSLFLLLALLFSLLFSLTFSYFLVLFLFFISLLSSLLFELERHLELWNYLCKMIGIKDIVLHKVAGTTFIPWTKNQPFIYFLSKTQIQKLDQSSE